MEGGNFEQRLTEPSISQSAPGIRPGTAAAGQIHLMSNGLPPPPLTWQQRLQVLVAVARALVYMHGLSPPMVHRDVKPANVLLKDVDISKVTSMDMISITKLADFGTARANTMEKQDEGEGEGESYAVTQLILGTVPHMPPEYMLRGRVSERTDAFAYGMVLVEGLTNMDAVGARQFCDAQYVISCAVHFSFFPLFLLFVFFLVRFICCVYERSLLFLFNFFQCIGCVCL